MAGRSSYPLLPTVLAGLVLAVGVTLGILLPPKERSAIGNGSVQTCPARSLSENVDAADLIVTGTVFAVVPGDPYAKVLITTQRVFHGTVPKNGIVLLALPESVGGGAATGDLHFTSADEAYLLFLNERPDGAYTTSRCDGSRLLGSGLTGEEASALNQKQ